MRLTATIASVLLVAWLGLCWWQLFAFAPTALPLNHRFVLRSLVFSLQQATLSTLASLLLTLPLVWGAWAGRWQVLRHLLPITTILPTLLLVFIALETGRLLGITVRGFAAIISLHALLNAPLLALLLLPTLEHIPHRYHQLRHLLRQSALSYGLRVLLPLLRPALVHGLSLVFLLCLTSFTVPLIVGGDPRYATLELAIYQSVKYEFNLPLAAQLALLQWLVLLPLFTLMPKTPPRPAHRTLPQRWHKASATVCETLGVGLLLLPLLIMLWQAVPYLAHPVPKALWQAMGDSLRLAGLTVPPALLLHFILLHGKHSQRLLETLYLMPTLILCLGSYLLAKPYVSLFNHPQLANALLLTLTVQPYLYKLAHPTFAQHQIQTQRLKALLGLSGLRAFGAVDLPALAPLFARVTGLCAVVCVGDVAISRFYSNPKFQTLAAYVSEELGHYRQALAWQSGLYLLIFSLLLFALPQLCSYCYLRLRKP